MRRRFLAPEVVQTSALDCGPAALKSLLEGFGISAGYDRLREACQTDLDGTSIDTIEEVANDLGLAAEQVMVPCDHLARDGATLPAIVVVRLPQNLTHFVLVWRRVGPFFQIMDPATGRRWVPVRQFLSEVYLHQLAASGEDWKEWAGSGAAMVLLGRRLADAGIGAASELIGQARRAAGWQGLATLDAAGRLTETLAARRAVRRGREAEELLRALLDAPSLIPGRYWNAKPIAGAAPDADARITGAVLIRIPVGQPSTAGARYRGRSSDVAAAVAEKRPTPFRHLFGYLRREPAAVFGLTAACVIAAAGCLVAEPLLFRAGVDFRSHLTTNDQRLLAIGYVALFAGTVLLLEYRLLAELLRLGRLLEARFRVAWLRRLAALHDRYFRSRLVSDMAERTHATHHLHDHTQLLGRLGQAVATLALVSLGIVLVQPSSASVVTAACLTMLGLSLAFVPAVQRHDVKLRTHSGALTRFYLDALRGLTAIRAHSGEAAVRREHESLLVEWHIAGRAHARSLLALETLQAAAGFAFAGWLIQQALAHGNDPATVLLIAYWAFTYPRLGVEIAAIVKQRAEQRSVALRLIEPLGADTLERAPERAAADVAPATRCGVAIGIHGVTVRAGGHTVLHNLDLEIASGEHVAIVGASGAGKSTLLGLLLGFRTASSGVIEIDGRGLAEASLAAVRAETAWIDPVVQLWNGPLERNVLYGARSPDAEQLAIALRAAGLYDLVERLGGLQAPVGEAGGLLSGGEGQRIRLARACMRSDVRLALLDEPFRGLDRDTRRSLLEHARRLWEGVTLLCVTHDLRETLAFDRVVLLGDGAILESGNPQELASRSETRYAQLLARERETDLIWRESQTWRQLRLDRGEIAWQPSRPDIHDERPVSAHLAAR